MNACPGPYQIPVRLEHPIAHKERCKNCGRIRRTCGPGRRSDVSPEMRTLLRLHLEHLDQIYNHPNDEILGLSNRFKFLDDLRDQICLVPYYAIEDGEVKEKYRSLCEDCEENETRRRREEGRNMFRS